MDNIAHPAGLIVVDRIYEPSVGCTRIERTSKPTKIRAVLGKEKPRSVAVHHEIRRSLPVQAVGLPGCKLWRKLSEIAETPLAAAFENQRCLIVFYRYV